MATASEKRQAVVDKYRGILGRNLYSQARRTYCFVKHSNGKYYSDCSSSVALSYKAAGIPIRDRSGYACPNTVGMMQSPDLKDVSVVIKGGVIQNPEALRLGDLLLFAGSDSGRAYAGYVGHVEMVYRIQGKTVTLCGHGSGTPRTTEMNAYCRSRYAQKTSTKLGNKGLIAVRRRIADDGDGGGKQDESTAQEAKNMRRIEVTGNTVNLREGPGTQYGIAKVVKKGETLDTIGEENGWTPVLVDGKVRWISGKYAKPLDQAPV